MYSSHYLCTMYWRLVLLQNRSCKYRVFKDLWLLTYSLFGTTVRCKRNLAHPCLQNRPPLSILIYNFVFSNIHQTIWSVANGGSVCFYISKATWADHYLGNSIGHSRGQGGGTLKVELVSDSHCAFVKNSFKFTTCDI